VGLWGISVFPLTILIMDVQFANGINTPSFQLTLSCIVNIIYMAAISCGPVFLWFTPPQRMRLLFQKGHGDEDDVQGRMGR
jgi:hypothetical protein